MIVLNMVEISMKLIKDDINNITKLVLKQNGQAITALKK